jgi:hypothetical protein
MTAEQSYATHVHRPLPTSIAGVFALGAMICFMGAWVADWPTRDLGMISLALAVVVLVSISRLYTVRLQDRIILLEMKVRGAELLTPEQETKLAALRPKQIAALRFASDQELAVLVERAARENLTPDQIKRAVTSWRPDRLRT